MSKSQSVDSNEPLDLAWAEIRRLELEPYVADLDINGFTVIPPEIASPGDLHKRLLDSVLDVAERRTGVRPDLDGGSTHQGFKGRFEGYAGSEGDSPIGEYFQSLIFEGDAFEEALMNPVLLAMTTYLCGYSVVLSSMSTFIKGQNETSFDFHSDTLIPAPLPAHALICNATYVLTDFTRENGATAFVPGSHKWGRHPRDHEKDVTGPHAHPRAVAAEGPAGSLVVWHGATWHGAFNRTNPQGLRVSIPVLMARHMMRTEEDLFGHVPQEMLDRHPTRFAWLLQQGISYGFHSQEGSEHRAPRARALAALYREEMRLPQDGRIDFDLYG
jgi:ectoine hydroxylase-related dioxygenase (phytanoyl-CoA dioxygenase family)